MTGITDTNDATSSTLGACCNSEPTFDTEVLLWLGARHTLYFHRFLLSNGAASSADTPDCNGNTPLHMACLRGNLAIMFMLLSEFNVGGGPQAPSR